MRKRNGCCGLKKSFVALVGGLCAFVAAGFPLNPSFTPEAVKGYKAKADAGDAEAQYLYSYALINGLGVPKDAWKGLDYARKSVEQGYERAALCAGEAHQRWFGVKTDADKAAKYLSRFVVWAAQAAEQGDANAQCNLGYAYANGLGVETNAVIAVKWYRKAAEQGDSEGQLRLGLAYAHGAGVVKDEEAAVRWYCKSAESGSALAKVELWRAYRDGNGVVKDRAEAERWLHIAAEEGSDAALNNLWVMYDGGWWGSDKNPTEALKWLSRKAEIIGDARSAFRVAETYADGVGVAKNMAEAVKWYRMAAERGDLRAQERLGDCYAKGNGVVKNMSEALKWFRNAAEQGDEASKWALCWCYKKGIGVAKDKTEFKKWYRKCGCPSSREFFKMTLCYEREFALSLMIFVLLAIGIEIYSENLVSVKQFEALKAQRYAWYGRYKRFEILLILMSGLLFAGIAAYGLPEPSDDMPFGIAAFLGELISDGAVLLWILSFVLWGIAINKFLMMRREKPANDAFRMTYSQYVNVVLLDQFTNFSPFLLFVIVFAWAGRYSLAAVLLMALVLLFVAVRPTRKKYEKLLNGMPAKRTGN